MKEQLVFIWGILVKENKHLSGLTFHKYCCETMEIIR